ncbi:MAG: phospholipase D-like domain-containing protein, partial [Desulfovermiculus sp.]
MIQRYSSRRQQLSSSFLTQRLQNAVSYDRIAGYFNSSLLEAAGEALESVTNTVRIVCNSDLNIQDVATAKAAQFALHRSWCLSSPENDAELSKPRFARLFQLLKNEKLDVKILPDTQFGLIHGKAGVITLADGRKTSFLGSVNESYSGWRLNYELLWEDDSEEAVKWVQEEFDALWSNPYAVRLSQFVVQDIERLAKRTVIPNVELWKEAPEPAVPVIETPVYRKEYGLWEHQKYFVKKAFDAHRTRQGARYVLADQVGLGKTLQLALSAMLMALHGDRPILVIAPKTLLWQWQNEMLDLLDLPSAVWTTKGWIDENGIEHPQEVPKGILKCPRRIGLVSQGLITRGSEAAQCLRQKHYECIIVDETHRARRKNLSASQQGERPVPNNLLAFLLDIAQQSKSLLLATATPVQLYPIESWDLLNVLSKGNDHVLGNEFSLWRRRPLQGLRIVMGQASLPEDDYEYWSWLRNPLPPGQEFRDYQLLRRSLRLSDHDFVAPGDAWEQLSPADKTRARKLRTHLTRQHNPYIRHIIRRTRDYLEQTINPETNEPYLPPVNVELFGEKQEEAILLPTYLQDAYTCAEEFCRLLGERVQGAGFLKTLLLRRLGSSIYAGQKTGERILQKWQNAQLLEEEEETDEEELQAIQGQRIFHDLSDSEIQTLRRFIQTLETNQEKDPKYTSIIEYLLYKGWLQRGVIIFSQYFDSVQWLADQLSI